MNNFRLIGQKRTYRERAQPTRRKGKGFLEKKRDYVLRARNYKEKKAQLKALKRHAELRNSDEFYFVKEKKRFFFFFFC
jgi:U3 small nucleolar RNA-associated protein 11